MTKSARRKRLDKKRKSYRKDNNYGTNKRRVHAYNQGVVQTLIFLDKALQQERQENDEALSDRSE